MATRKPKFKRNPIDNIRLQDQDIFILKEVYKYRFLTSAHIRLLLPDAGQQYIIRRLNRLYHAGYLDRPKAQLKRPGNQKMVYALGNQGAEVLAEELDLDMPNVDWTTKNRETGSGYIEHELMIADFMVKVRLACKKLGLGFIEEESIINHRPQPAGIKDHPRNWKVEIQEEKRKYKVGITPDYVFGIHYRYEKDGKEKGKTFYYFLEADRSTQPIRRGESGKTSSFYRKLFVYHNTWRQKQFAPIWGFSAPKILTLTISEPRIKSMIDAFDTLAGENEDSAFNIFLYAMGRGFNFEEPEEVLNRIWKTGKRVEGQPDTRAREKNPAKQLIVDKVSPLDTKGYNAIIRADGKLMFTSSDKANP